MSKAKPKRILNCTLGFECKQVWSALKTTPAPDVRYCTQKTVTFCHSQAELDLLAEQGRCVAFYAAPERVLTGSVKQDNSKPTDMEALRKFIDTL